MSALYTWVYLYSRCFYLEKRYLTLSTILSLREYKKCFNDIPAVFVCRVDLADTQPPYQKYYTSYMKVTLE